MCTIYVTHHERCGHKKEDLVKCRNYHYHGRRGQRTEHRYSNSKCGRCVDKKIGRYGLSALDFFGAYQEAKTPSI